MHLLGTCAMAMVVAVFPALASEDQSASCAPPHADLGSWRFVAVEGRPDTLVGWDRAPSSGAALDVVVATRGADANWQLLAWAGRDERWAMDRLIPALVIDPAQPLPVKVTLPEGGVPLRAGLPATHVLQAYARHEHYAKLVALLWSSGAPTAGLLSSLQATSAEGHVSSTRLDVELESIAGQFQPLQAWRQVTGAKPDRGSCECGVKTATAVIASAGRWTRCTCSYNPETDLTTVIWLRAASVRTADLGFQPPRCTLSCPINLATEQGSEEAKKLYQGQVDCQSIPLTPPPDARFRALFPPVFCK